MTTNKRIEGYKKGRRAEWFCAIVLFFKGYRLLKNRFKTPVGEIDLVVKKGKNLVFVEVKARNSYREGVEAVTLKSQKRIRRAGEYFLMKNPKYMNFLIRFDVMVVNKNTLPYHIKNAWV